MSNTGGTCDGCHEYSDSIQCTLDFGDICIDCSLMVMMPYIQYAMREIEERIDGTEIEDNSIYEMIGPHLVDKLEDSIMKHRKRLEELESLR